MTENHGRSNQSDFLPLERSAERQGHPHFLHLIGQFTGGRDAKGNGIIRFMQHMESEGTNSSRKFLISRALDTHFQLLSFLSQSRDSLCHLFVDEPVSVVIAVVTASLAHFAYQQFYYCKPGSSLVILVPLDGHLYLYLPEPAAGAPRCHLHLLRIMNETPMVQPYADALYSHLPNDIDIRPAIIFPFYGCALQHCR